MYFCSYKHEWKKTTIQTYDVFDGYTFLEFLKIIHIKFPKCYLFIDKASPHYKSKMVQKYFVDNKDNTSRYFL
jgi:hypothetical protein